MTCRWLGGALLVAVGVGCATDSDNGRGGSSGSGSDSMDMVDGAGRPDLRDGGSCGDSADREDCPCALDESHECYTGPSETRGKGVCGDGVQECVASNTGEFHEFGACEDDTLPGEEDCDGSDDDDCDGTVDENCPCSGGETRECPEGCEGDGLQTCEDGDVWGPCVCKGKPGKPPGNCSPRLISPLSTARVTTQMPMLQWELGKGGTGVRVELCADRACTDVRETLTVMGETGAPTVALPRAVTYWRAFSVIDGVEDRDCPPSHTWEFFVNSRSAPVDASWGTILDVNGDGFADMAVTENVEEEQLSYLFMGSKDGLDDAPVWTVEGYFATSAGDVNGDGFADMVVQARARDEYHLYLGGPGGVTDKHTVLNTPGSREPVDWPEQHAASAGDSNRDGYADVVLGARGLDHGVVYVFHGGADGLTPEPTLTLVQDQYSHGEIVANGGDINADGFGDVIITAGHSGGVFFYYGSEDGLSVDATDFIDEAVAGDKYLFGVPSTGGGDVNGDGYADALLAQAWDSNLTQPPGVWVYLGGPHGIAKMPAIHLVPPGYDMQLVKEKAHIRVTALDADGDGFWDVAVADPALLDAFIFMGSAAGVEATPAWTLDNDDFKYQGRIGEGMSGADVHHDGFEDLVLGAPWGTGQTFRFDGSAAGATQPHSQEHVQGRGFGIYVSLGASGT